MRRARARSCRREMRWRIEYVADRYSPLRVSVEVIAPTVEEARILADRMVCQHLPVASGYTFVSGTWLREKDKESEP